MDGYPFDPAFRAKYIPRGVLRCTATTVEPAGEDPRYGKWGKQNCTDTGPLTKARMERVDEEFIEGASKFMEKSVADQKPFFLWLNTTRTRVHARALVLQGALQDDHQRRRSALRRHAPA